MANDRYERTRANDRGPNAPRSKSQVVKWAVAGVGFTVAIVLILFLCGVFTLCEKREWSVSAPGFEQDQAKFPTQEQVFEQCGLKEFGFSAKSVCKKKAAASNAAVSQRVKERLPSKFPEVFVGAKQESLISRVELDIPGESAGVDAGITIRIERRSEYDPPDPIRYDDAKKVAELVKNDVSPLLEALKTEGAGALTSVGAIRLDGSGRDLPLFDLLVAETKLQGVAWTPPTTIDGINLATAPSLIAYRTNAFASNYDRSYCYWNEALEAMKSMNVSPTAYANNWPSRVANLKILAASYDSAMQQKRYFADNTLGSQFRVDGSVLTLAQYALLTMYLEGYRAGLSNTGKPVHEALGVGSGKNSEFVKIGEHLLSAVRALEGGDVKPTIAGLRYEGSNGPNLFGGRLMYFSLSAVISLEKGDREGAKTFMRQALISKNHFESNHPPQISSYLYCYLLRAGTTNARICSILEYDNWATEWLKFAKDCGPLLRKQGSTSPVHSQGEFSHFYHYLGKVTAANSLKDELNSPNAFGQTRTLPQK